MKTAPRLISWSDREQRYTIGVTVNGQRVRRHAATLERAEEVRADLLRLREQGTLSTTPRQTLEQYLCQWLQAKEGTVRPVTAQSYLNQCRLIIRVVGGTRLDAITPMHLHRVSAELRAIGYAPSTIRLAHIVFKHALADAVRWELLAKNPADASDAPRVPKTERMVLSPDEIARLIDVSCGTRWHALWALLGFTGMRIGEALGLQWPYLRDDAGEILIRWNAARVPGGGRTLAEVKTESSRRTLYVVPGLVEPLRRHRAIQAEERLKTWGWTNPQLVFPSLHGELLDTKTVKRAFDRDVAAAGLPSVTIHTIRHSVFTAMLANGAYPRAVQQMAGHANISTTLGLYGHVLPAMHRDVAYLMDEMVRRRKA